MQKLTDLIKENDETKTYKYVAEVTVEGTVTASSEGDAGDAADKEIDAIEGVTNFKMTSLDEIDAVKEDADILLNDDADERMREVYQDIVELFENSIATMTTYHETTLVAQLTDYLNTYNNQ